jgi:hypothetical protein
MLLSKSCTLEPHGTGRRQAKQQQHSRTAKADRIAAECKSQEGKRSDDLPVEAEPAYKPSQYIATKSGLLAFSSIAQIILKHLYTYGIAGVSSPQRVTLVDISVHQSTSGLERPSSSVSRLSSGQQTGLVLRLRLMIRAVG